MWMASRQVRNWMAVVVGAVWLAGCTTPEAGPLSQPYNDWPTPGQAPRPAQVNRPLNIALFAPMPSARVRTATTVKPGLLSNIRTAKRKSCHGTF